MDWPVVEGLRPVKRSVIIAGAIALLGMRAFLGTNAHAQSISERFPGDSLFQTTLLKPSNLDATLRYAATTGQVGDIEASIGALERLLFYNPRLARVRFELGRLYYLLGSYEMARGYFQTVLAAADATPEMKQRSREYLDAIDKELQPDRWSGYAQTGLRFQTNASFGPTQQSLIGATRPINSQLLPQSDWNWFGAFGLNYVHDFGNQNGSVFEASILGYDAQQFKVTAVDVGLLDIRAGPRFGIFQDSLSGASLEPYVVTSGAILAGAPYLGSIGGGVTMHFNWANVAWDPYVEVRDMAYRNSGLYPLASGLDGSLVIVALQATGPIIDGVRWQGRVAYYRSDDAAPWFSYDRYAFDIWFPCTVASPWGGRSWTVTPSFAVSPWFYREPDPAIVPLITEHALEWRAGIGLDIPIQDRFGLGVQLQYRAINSNVPGNTVTDLSVTMGPTVSF